MQVFKIVRLLSSCVLLLACQGTWEEQATNTASIQLPPRLMKPKEVPSNPAQAIYNAKGKKYILVGKAKILDQSDLSERDRMLNNTAPEPSLPDPAQLSDEQLAQMLRSRVLHKGWEYIEAEPPRDVVKKIREAKPEDLVTTERGPDFLWQKEDDVQSQGQKYVIGPNDDRYQITSRGFPISTAIMIWTDLNKNGLYHPSDDSHCTGTVIGRRMAASAAHCFYWNGAWFDWQNTWITPAHGVEPGNPIPYGNFGLYDVEVAHCWNGTTQTLNCDYARIEFFAEEPIGAWVGYRGTKPWIEAYKNTLHWLYGYSGDKLQPSLWYRENETVWMPDSWELDYLIDTVDGDSGAGVLHEGRLVGIHSRGRSQQECRWPWDCYMIYWNAGVAWSPFVHAFFSESGIWPD